MKAALALLVCGTLSAAAVLATRSVASADSVKDLLGGSNPPNFAPHYEVPQENQSTFSHDYRHGLYITPGFELPSDPSDPIRSWRGTPPYIPPPLQLGDNQFAQLLEVPEGLLPHPLFPGDLKELPLQKQPEPV